METSHPTFFKRLSSPLLRNDRHRVKAQTKIKDFNAEFCTTFDGKDYDTIGGLVLNQFGKVPGRKEQISIGKLTFIVLRADQRHLYTLLVIRQSSPQDVVS